MNNFGWEAPWGSFGGGGGVKKPANPDDILQWITAYDGITPFVDKKTLVDSPATVGVNALDFDGTQIVTTGLTNPKNDWYVSACINLDTMAHNHEVVSLAATSSVRYIYILTDGRLQCRINGTIYTSTGTITFNQRVRIVSKRVADVVTLEAYTQGGSLLFSDVVASNSSTLNDGDVIVGGRTTGTFVEGVINGVIVGTSEEDLLFNYPMEEGSGLPYDVSGNGNHATSNTATWITADGIPSYNLLNGFRVATQQTAPYIPALLDGTSAADGNPITNKGGYAHNGAECSILQTDAFNSFGAGASFWGDGSTTWDAKSYADLRAHTNGLTNTWLKCVNIDGVPHYKETVQYDVDDMWTPAEYQKNANYFGDKCDTGVLVPAEVTAGTGIGPSGTWADNGDGKVLLVEDA